MRHGILGAGGVGGLIGAVLAQAGDEVTLIVRPGSEKSYPHDLSLDSRLGKISAPVTVVSRLEQPLDVLWIATKATQLENALESIPVDAEIGTVVPLLNGIDHISRLRERFGDGRVVAGTIAVESERVAPGKIVHSSPFLRLNLAANGRERLAGAMETFQRFGFEGKFVEDETTLLWGKLAFLAPVALSTAAARAPIGPVREDPTKWAKLQACVREACAVAAAVGAKVDTTAILSIIQSVPGGTRSSMEKDVANGNPTEVDAIGGPILRAGKKYGIAVPVTEELVREIVRK